LEFVPKLFSIERDIPEVNSIAVKKAWLLFVKRGKPRNK
jgi:hypothetical protein